MEKLNLKTLLIGLVIIFTSFFSNNAFAEESFDNTKIETIIIMKNGTTLSANILEKKDKELTIYTKDLGKITINTDNIKEIKFIDNQNDINKINFFDFSKLLPNIIKKKEEKEEKIEVEQTEKKVKKKWFDNPTDTRLFLLPTAKMLKQGKGYFQDIDIVVTSANFGITDNISIGGIATIIPFIGIQNQVFLVTPKFGIEINKDFSIAGSIFYGSGAGVGQIAVGYAAATYGNSDNNITLGVGAGTFSAFSSRSSLVSGVNIGGMYRITENMSFLTENWFVLNSGVFILPSLGVRFFSDKLSADLGFTIPSSFGNNTFPIPYIDFVFSF